MVQAARVLLAFLAPCANADILPLSLVRISTRLSYSLIGDAVNIIPVTVTGSLMVTSFTFHPGHSLHNPWITHMLYLLFIFRCCAVVSLIFSFFLAI